MCQPAGAGLSDDGCSCRHRKGLGARRLEELRQEQSALIFCAFAVVELDIHPGSERDPERMRGFAPEVSNL